jgi:hypothetical protein
VALELRERFGPVLGLPDLVRGALQDRAENDPIPFVVVHD